MGPLVMTGLVLFGAAIGLGVLASQTRPAADPADAPRIRAILMVAAAFTQSLGVLAVAAGFLAVELGGAAGQTSAVLVAGLAVAGALVGIVLIAGHAGRVDPPAVLIVAMFVIGLGTLGATTGILAIALDEGGSSLPPDWPFVGLGLVSGSCALALGWVGSRALVAASVHGADLSAIHASEIRRSLPLLLVGLGALGLGMLILFLG